MEHLGVDNPVDLMLLQAPDFVLFQAPVQARVDHHEQVAAFVGGVLRPPDHVTRERGGGNLVTDQADNLRALVAQSAGEPVGGIAQVFGDRPDVVLCFRFDPGAVDVVERVGDGSDRNPGGLRHIPYPDSCHLRHSFTKRFGCCVAHTLYKTFWQCQDL